MDPAGDLPRSGGLVETSLFSNIARRLRTPPDILTDSRTLSLKRQMLAEPRSLCDDSSKSPS